ncbi:hypothetical protein PHMEG_00010022 [Phytophthora megakarya]|uniref:Exodeoxyribonuclease X-like C-terminal domain-containing protein n=1 Tax=Phytophthora megakarya TaxID=4795 RepID=A0A225WGH0_9STRA|nr:hypothetical protein PHMEG_00010022 [Phytophthora megakarya]
MTKMKTLHMYMITDAAGYSSRSAIAVDASKNMSLTSTTLSSGNVCPIMIASATTNNPMASVLANSGSFSIAWGAVVNSLEPTIDGTYMPFTTARLYVPFVHLENPQAIISKPVKKFYQRAGTGKQTTQFNASFDLQLSASVKNAKYVVLLPFVEQTDGSSIRKFNVRIGSQQCFDISHDYDFRQFSDEVSKLGAINGDLTPELVNGLLDYQTWSLTNRMLIADVSRLTEKDIPQAIQIQGVNAGCQGVNLLVLVVSEQELTYDRLTDIMSISFGKYKGSTIEDVFERDPSYCRWLRSQEMLVYLIDVPYIQWLRSSKFATEKAPKLCAAIDELLNK